MNIEMLFVVFALFGGVLVKQTFLKPYSFVLLLYGVMIGVLNNHYNFSSSIDDWSRMSPKMFLLYFIPPIIYQACLMLNMHMFKKLFWLVVWLSILGVGTTNVMTSLFIGEIDERFSGKWKWLLGSVLSAIDPVAITMVLPELKVSEKLSNLIEIESLLNDEAALTVFYIMYGYLVTELSWRELVVMPLKEIGGSSLIALVIMGIQLFLLRQVYGDVLAQVTLSIIFCYVAYLVSEYTILDTSGILTVLILGLSMSGFGKTRLRPENLEQFNYIWKLFAYYSDILIFSVSGLVISQTLDYNRIEASHWVNLMGLYFFLNLIRGGVCILFRPWLSRHIFHYDMVDFCVMVLSGLRGEISLALSLIVYQKTEIDLEIRNLIVFYVSGVVVLTLVVNANVVRWLVHYYHRDRIMMHSQQVVSLNNHLDKEGWWYINQLKQEDDFHLSRVCFDKVKENLFPHLESNEVEELEMNTTQLEHNLFLNTLKKNIWNLFETHVLHADVVNKLIDITDSGLDNPDIAWNIYMNDYCEKEHVETPLVCLLSRLPVFNCMTQYIIFHRIEYSYNLTIGYMVSLSSTLKCLEDIIDDPHLLTDLRNEVHESLRAPQSYVEYLEERYERLLEKIETRNVSRLVISKQKTHIEQLVKNGEISERTYEILMTQLDEKESRL